MSSLFDKKVKINKTEYKKMSNLFVKKFELSSKYIYNKKVEQNKRSIK